MRDHLVGFIQRQFSGIQAAQHSAAETMADLWPPGSIDSAYAIPVVMAW
jgi:hypothetical protein